MDLPHPKKIEYSLMVSLEHGIKYKESRKTGKKKFVLKVLLKENGRIPPKLHLLTILYQKRSSSCFDPPISI